MKIIFISLLSVFFTTCGNPKPDNCGCCPKCDRSSLNEIEEKCGCCHDCGTGGCKEPSK